VSALDANERFNKCEVTFMVDTLIIRQVFSCLHFLISNIYHCMVQQHEGVTGYIASRHHETISQLHTPITPRESLE
jgi:hypothetical protein